MSTSNPRGGRDWTQVPVHPAASIFPMMDSDELHLHTADIQKNGQREPIVLYRGQILDGRNRLAACLTLGIEPHFCEIDESSPELFGEFNPFDYVISLNLARRHLTKSQAAAIAAEHLPNFVAEAEVRKLAAQKLGGRGHKKTIGKNLPIVSAAAGKAVEKAAKAFGVSAETVRQAAKVKEASPDVHEQVKAGEITVNAAAKKISGDTPAPPSLHCDGNGQQIPVKLQPVFYARKRFHGIVQQFGKLLGEIESLAADSSGTFLAERLNTIRADLKNAQRAVKFCAPHQVCPYCRGKGCEPTGTSKAPCRGTGWTIRGVKGPGK